MLSFRRIHITSFLLVVVLTLLTCVACSSHDDAPMEYGGNKYINLSIAVSTSGHAGTRTGEIPAGGENGDGREAGFKRENEVTGVTLFFYEAADGINASDETTISYTVYYPVSPAQVKRDQSPKSESDITDETRPNDSADEYVFTTGDRRLEVNKIIPSKEYHVIAVLNDDLSLEGLTTLGKVRDYRFSTLYSGKGNAENCTNFVMTSEQDFTLKLSDVTPTVEGKNQYYRLETPLRVERLAARIDFQTEYGSGKVCQGYNSIYKGYEYNVGSTADKFVVTAITPFNVYTKSATRGGEYLIKRLTDSFESAKIKYLEDEASGAPETDKYCYVLDPETKDKESAWTSDNMVNTLKGTGGLNDDLTLSFSGKAVDAYPYQTIELLYATLHEQGGSDSYTGGLKLMESSVNTGDIVIIGYPMENTLGPKAKLYDCATGLSIEGDYYQGGFSGTKTHLIYYGFLRHQGESSGSYATYPMTTNLTELQAKTCSASIPMNYSVVRNNIYRVSIESITPRSSTDPLLKIKVKKWDPYLHAPIYM